jgi:hypothetical protein
MINSALIPVFIKRILRKRARNLIKIEMIGRIVLEPETGIRVCTGETRVREAGKDMAKAAGRRVFGGLAALLLAGAVLPPMATGSRAEDRVPGEDSDTVPRAERGGEPQPLRSYTDEEGRTCRVYERRVVIDGGPATALATVCRDASGRWVLSR